MTRNLFYKCFIKICKDQVTKIGSFHLKYCETYSNCVKLKRY